MSYTLIAVYVAGVLIAGVVLNLGGWWATLRLIGGLGTRLELAPYVAIRHLRGRKSGFLTAIGVLSIFGVSISSCTLVSVLSVMGGFSGDLKQKILKTNAHVVVDVSGDDIEGWEALLPRILEVEGVAAATPIVQGEMMMNARSNNHAIVLKGIDPATFRQVSGALDEIDEGELEFLADPAELFSHIHSKRRRLYGSHAGADGGVAKDAAKETIPPPVSPRQRVLSAVLVGRELKKSLRLYVGEEVNIISPLGDIGPTGPIPKSRPFRVGGVFFTGMYEFDSLFVYTRIDAAQKFLSKGNRISEIHITVDDPERPHIAAGRIAAALGGPWRVRSWAELNASLFAALKLEKIVISIILGIAILVSSFCIVATLTMLVLEKSAEVSVLMTLGSSVRQIRNIFLFEGLLIGVVGTASGLAAGFGLCSLLQRVGLPIDPELWYIDRLPVQMTFAEFFGVGLASLIITQVATLFPANRAARVTPVEGLKNE
jgi:lipoprotein-releasing system permease protein